MTFEVAIDDRLWTIDVEARDGLLSVECDGRVTLVDAVPIAGGLSLIFPDGGLASREVLVTDTALPGGLIVQTGGAAFHVEVQPAGRARRARVASQMASVVGARPVLAPMPGRVVRVLVQPGDRVEPRQSLVVMEAMKMENELRSPKGGVVTSVEVIEGATVDAGAVLVIVE